MVNRKKIVIASLIGVPLLVGASYLSLRNISKNDGEQIRTVAETPAESRPANNLYVERRQKEEKLNFEKWLYGLGESRNNDKDAEAQDSRPLLEEMIEHLGYNHLRSNVSSLEEAQLICLGEIHRLCGNEEAYILGDKFVGEHDKILVEQSPPFVVDFPAMHTARDEIRKKQKEQRMRHNQELIDWFSEAVKPESERKILRNMGGADQFNELRTTFEALDIEMKHFAYLMSQDGLERSFFSGLALHNRGIVIGADAPRDVKVAHLYSAAERVCLPKYVSAVKSGEKVHPFLEWMVHDASGIISRSANPEDKIKAINEYLSAMPSDTEHMRRRDEHIAENTLREVKSNQPGIRTWYIFGARHLGDTLFNRLEREGIRYVAFAPIEEKVAADSKTKEVILSGKLSEEHEKEYLETNIFPWYAKEKLADGKPAYSGNFERVVR